MFLYPFVNRYEVRVSTNSVTRVGGANRYETAAMFAKKNWSSDCKNVILVSGTSYSDPLIVYVLAGKYNSPLILMDLVDREGTKHAIEYIKCKN